MKNFLKNNWFKLVIIILILIVSIGYFEYFNLKIKQQNQIIQQINNSDSTKKISASDLAPYLTGVVYVLCNGESGSGSLTLQDSSGSFAVTNLHVVSSPFVDKNGNTALAKERVLVENVIGMLKRFKIISDRYRNRRKRFGLLFSLLAGLYNYELKI